MRPRYVKSTQKNIENSKDQLTGTRRGHDGTTDSRGTCKPDHTLKVIRNPIPRNLDNTRKGIQNLYQTESGASGREG